MNKQYEINRPAEKCVMCGKPIIGMTKHPTTLHADDSQNALLRNDYCETCWEKVKEKDYFSYWVTRRVPRSGKEERQKKETARQTAIRLFEQMMQSEDEDRTARLYILAHLLLRFRIFKWKGSEINGETGQAQLVFERATTREEVKIPDMRLSEEQLAEAQHPGRFHRTWRTSPAPPGRVGGKGNAARGLDRTGRRTGSRLPAGPLVARPGPDGAVPSGNPRVNVTGYVHATLTKR